MLGASYTEDDAEEEPTYTEEEYQEALDTQKIRLKHNFTIKRMKAIEDKLSNGLVDKVEKHGRFISQFKISIKFFILVIIPIGTGLAVAYFSGILW